jgi:hypothetical protein
VVPVPLREILALTARLHRHLLENFQPSFLVVMIKPLA